MLKKVLTGLVAGSEASGMHVDSRVQSSGPATFVEGDWSRNNF